MTFLLVKNNLTFNFFSNLTASCVILGLLKYIILRLRLAWLLECS